MADELKQIAIRMVEQPPLYSNEPMNSPEAAIRIMNEFLSQMDRELFCVVNLNADYTPINMNIVSVGALNESMVHPRELFKAAILSNAQSMMLIHNHPSGNLIPSSSDIQVTGRLQQLGDLMGIPIVDHIITGRNHQYYSFRDKGTFPDERVYLTKNIADINLMTDVVTEESPAYQTSTIPLPASGKDMDSIMESLEAGVENLFRSERYAEYLKVMSKFHHYSFNNTLLIAMQRPDASYVTGYRNWQSMGRQVRKGEKGITIIAPAPVKQRKLRTLYDQNNNPVLDQDGKPKQEEVEVTIPKFKATTVFDIGQTDGDPIPDLSPEELSEAVKDYDLFLNALKDISPVPIRFDEIESGAKGYYHNVDKEIVIQEGMSESQTIKTLIHESAHARLHDKDFMKGNGIEKDRTTKEVEAESVAFSVCHHFGVDTSEYSFPYIAGWSAGRDMKVLKESMDIIRQTSGEMIDELQEKITALYQDKHLIAEIPDVETMKAAMEATGYYFDQSESTQDLLSFFPDGLHTGGSMVFDSWQEVNQFLEEIIDRKIALAERVEYVLHPERFEKTFEEMMYEGNGDRFTIYQITERLPDKDYKFQDMDYVKEHNITIEARDYEAVYSGKMQVVDSPDVIYSVFNTDKPADFKGHSVSVSDVIVTHKAGETKAFYVDSIGYQELPDFIHQRKFILGMEEEKNFYSNLDKSPASNFYVAECSEFPVMGEFHQDLTMDQALKIYDSIPSDRMHGRKSIGIQLADGSDYEGMYDLIIVGRSQRDYFDLVPALRDNPEIKNTLATIEDVFAKREKEQNKPKEQEVKPKRNTPKRSKRKEVECL